ncbi:zinc ABC transporter substrate-binding protein AztC [Phyllobacterium sp. 0TCS1.6C]|uniref:zinc ABC transporter substrate-binding protein AztC n=1 Tax=unclassified Phyllobacterium TaxID=2638441 RepID=UPI0022651456|nr:MULTISPECIES: zinc ABC transporter substrate-binding protein AztC [unclassified Phyllobacterium]MCX8280878.1 zinc ABC transporter substrate-binding protein AztC [Phyllobacterium sp. 0TCS1.6C]MCX8295744.1 zinc ABC transporter substrate-binding protein AztC [Phyllobacterium sp. 0TCS1.6A]
MKKSIKLAALLNVIALLGGYTAAHADNLKVVASFSIIADFARNVGGDRIELTTLVGPNGDAHVYEPRPADAAALSSADVILVNGLHFEGFLPRLVEASATKAPIVELTKGIEPLKSEAEEHEHGHAEGEHAEHKEEHAGHDHGAYDPHAFQSIANARIYVRNIVDAFCAADAKGCETYKANGTAYDKQLEATEADVKAAINAIPQEKRLVITSHDAFGYFERAYGLKFLAPEGISTDSEASAADIAKLIEQVREDKASAIFVENITNPRLIEQIASETGLAMGDELFSDALSKPGEGAGTYIEMMEHNAEAFKRAIVDKS